MRMWGLFIIIFVLVLPSALRAEEITLTLDEVIAIAIRDNHDILLQAEEVKKAKASMSEARAGRLPSVNVSGGWEYARGLYNEDKAQFSTQVGIKQYLYQGGAVVNTIEYDGYKLESAQAVLDKAKLDIILNVKIAFYTLVLAGEYAQVNKGILDNTIEHLNLVKARYAAGEASESDILSIESSLSNIEEAYEASLNQIESARAILRNNLYLGNDVKVKPVGEFTYEPREMAYEEAFLKAMESRPEIRQYAAQEKAQAKAIDIAKAGSRPSIYASWDYYSGSHVLGPEGPVANWNDHNIIGIGFSWPIFDGWATKARVEQAIVDLKEAKLLKEKTVSDIALELKNAYLGLKSALAMMKSSHAGVDLYKNTALVVKNKYDAGIASLLDLHDADLGYKVALFNQKESVYDYAVYKARFDKAMGE